MLFLKRTTGCTDAQLRKRHDLRTHTTINRFLGVNLDNKLNVNCRVHSVLSKVKIQTIFYTKLVNFLALGARISFQYPFAYLNFSHIALMWGSTPKIA